MVYRLKSQLGECSLKKGAKMDNNGLKNKKPSSLSLSQIQKNSEIVANRLAANANQGVVTKWGCGSEVVPCVRIEKYYNKK